MRKINLTHRASRVWPWTLFGV